MKTDQITLRVDPELAAALEQQARERRMPKSQLVREALEAYVTGRASDTRSPWSQVESLVGSVSLDHAALRRDALARQVRAHNWRP